MQKNIIAPELLELFIDGIKEILPTIPPVAGALPEEKRDFLETYLIKAENDFGITSSSGLLFRCGGAAFKYLVRRHGKSMNIDSLDFRLQPQQKRLMDGTLKIIHQLESWQAAKFVIQKNDELVEISARSDLVAGSKSQNRIWLHFIAGMFQEYLGWAGSGKQYPFQIISPEVPGDEIIIQFRIVPVD